MQHRLDLFNSNSERSAETCLQLVSIVKNPAQYYKMTNCFVETVFLFSYEIRDPKIDSVKNMEKNYQWRAVWMTNCSIENSWGRRKSCYDHTNRYITILPLLEKVFSHWVSIEHFRLISDLIMQETVEHTCVEETWWNERIYAQLNIHIPTTSF